MTEQEDAISCIFPHADVEFDVTNGKKWTKDERLSYKRGALRGYLSDILPNRKYAYHYAIHFVNKCISNYFPLVKEIYPGAIRQYVI